MDIVERKKERYIVDKKASRFFREKKKDTLQKAMDTRERTM